MEIGFSPVLVVRHLSPVQHDNPKEDSATLVAPYNLSNVDSIDRATKMDGAKIAVKHEAEEHSAPPFRWKGLDTALSDASRVSPGPVFRLGRSGISYLQRPRPDLVRQVR